MFRNLGRVQRDFSEVINNDTGYIRMISDDYNMKSFDCEVDGPLGTPYHTARFTVNVTIPPNFPFDSPRMKMVTPIWHPNISTGGKICVNILSEEWTAGTSILELLEGLRGLMWAPNPSSPLNIEAARMMEDDSNVYNSVCLAYCNTFANGQISDPTIEEKLQVLAAHRMDRRQALQWLAASGCNVQRVIDLHYQDDE